jgi:TolB-like protein/cytochrome c-type biogenesis protein CcmH/NrfG
MSAKPSFFAELQRRNVYKVGAMYAVAGWLLVQVVTQVFPVFHVSERIQQWIVLAIVAGFPVVLVLSWIYELTPQGIVRTDEVAPDASISRHTGQQLNRAIIGVLTVAVLVLAAKLLWPRAAPTTAESGAPAPAANDKSIAVLPFENLSDDKANGYFAEGMQDEILTRLAKIGTLRVISRTSTLRYASVPDNIGEIAQQLGVANILEGSVQKAGNQVRINVQLIRAAGDSHLWAETYDRTLDNVFGVQGEVAGAIADALGAKLSGGERKELGRVPTQNAAAYDAYLRGLALYDRGFQNASFIESTQSFEEAVRADPDFALAWARLARGYALMIFFGFDASLQERDKALHALETAERLQPDLAEAQMARATYVYRVERNYDKAFQLFGALHQRWPNDSEAPVLMSYILARQGRIGEALQLASEALQLDPRNMQLLKLQVLSALNQRRIAEALKGVDRIQELVPGESESLVYRAQLYQMQGDLPQAAVLLDVRSMPQSDFDPYVQQARLERRYSPLIGRLQEIAEAGGTGLQAQAAIDARIDLADLQRLEGQPAAAAASYRRALEQAQAILTQQPENLPMLIFLAVAQAGLGEQDAALASINRAVALVPESRDVMDGRSTLEQRARLLARFGRRDEAIAALRYLLSVPYQFPLTPALVRLDPDFDNLHDDPRFQQLLAEGEAAMKAQNQP